MARLDEHTDAPAHCLLSEPSQALKQAGPCSGSRVGRSVLTPPPAGGGPGFEAAGRGAVKAQV